MTTKEERARDVAERALDRRMDPDLEVFYVYDNEIWPADTMRQRKSILQFVQKRTNIGETQLMAIVLWSVPRGETPCAADNAHNGEFYDWIEAK